LETPASKEELGGGLLGIIRWVSTKTLPTHSTFHLQGIRSAQQRPLKVCGCNKQKRQSHFWPCL